MLANMKQYLSSISYTNSLSKMRILCHIASEPTLKNNIQQQTIKTASFKKQPVFNCSQSIKMHFKSPKTNSTATRSTMVPLQKMPTNPDEVGTGSHIKVCGYVKRVKS
jgi:hypothetical protein